MRRNEWITFALSAALIGAIAIAPAPVRAVAGEDFYISDNTAAASVGVGTGCALPDVQYVEADGLEDALAAIYEDDDYGDDGDTIILCDIDADAGDADYLMHADVAFDDDGDPGTDPAPTYDAVDAAAAINLTIRGNAEDADSIIIDANDNDGADDGGYSPFDFTDTHLTIRNMTILNAWDDSAGAGIHHIQGDATDTVTLTLDTVVIEYAYAQGDGAGVWSGGDVDVSDSIFEDNGIGISVDGDGAGIFADGDVEVFNSMFEGNYANVQGGAIWAGGDVVVDGSDFYGNWNDGDVDADGPDTATGLEGGAVYALGDVIVISSAFEENTAHAGGGAIWAGEGVYVEQSQFVGNSATDGGGAISATSSASITAETTFVGNLSGGAGGALYIGAGGLIVENSTFIENESAEGGAINAQDTDQFVEIVRTEFKENVASLGTGGAIHSNSDIDVVSSTFVGNATTSEPFADGDGGAIYVTFGDSRIVASVFKENSASDSGGAVYLWDCDTAEFRDSTFIKNSAVDSGGAVNNNCDDDSSVVEVIGNRFQENVAFSYGGAMDNDAGYGGQGALVVYTKNTFVGNRLTGTRSDMLDDEDDDWGGGAVWVNAARFTRNTFRSNRVPTCGGAVFVASRDFNTLKSGRNKFSANHGLGSRRTWDVCR